MMKKDEETKWANRPGGLVPVVLTQAQRVVEMAGGIAVAIDRAVQDVIDQSGQAKLF